MGICIVNSAMRPPVTQKLARFVAQERYLMAKRKIGEVLWLALECAKSDRQSLVDAYSGNIKESAVRQAIADIKAFEALQVRLFGTSKSKLQAMIDSMTPVSVLKMLPDDFEAG
jgi:hypothetical protein